MVQRKKIRACRKLVQKPDLFDGLPDDVVECILSKLSSSASSPSDLISVLITSVQLHFTCTLCIFISRILFFFLFFFRLNSTQFFLLKQMQKIEPFRSPSSGLITSRSKSTLRQSQKLVRFSPPFPQTLRFRW